MENKKNIHKKILLYAILLLPTALVSGPFLPDLIVVLTGIHFLIYMWKTNQIKFLVNDFSKIFIIFYIYIVARSFFTEDILLSLKNSFFYFRFLLLVFLIKYLIIHEKKFIRLFFYSLVLTTFIVTFDAIAEFILGYHWLFDKTTYSEFLASKRISGLFDEEYILGSYLLRLYPIILTLSLLILDKRRTLLILLFTFLVFFTIIISGERTSIASFVVIILFLFLFSNLFSNFKRRLFTFLGFFIFMFLLTFLNEFLSNRLIFHSLNSFYSNASFSMPFDQSNYLSERRLKKNIEEHLGYSDINYTKDVIIARNNDNNDIVFIKEWNLEAPQPNKDEIDRASKVVQNKIDNKNFFQKKIESNTEKFLSIVSRKDKKIVYYSTEHQNHALIAIEMFKDNPIFGHGLKMFRVKCAKKKYYLGARSCTTHPHNIVLTFMSELGTIGLLFYVIGFFYIIKNLIIKNGNQKILLIGFMIYLIPILPSGYFFNNYASIIFYIGIGVYSGLKDIDINRSSL